MHLKKILTSMVAGVSLLASVGLASAADINIYGASAQYTLWSSIAPAFLANQGCANIQSAAKDSKNAITKATCSGVTTYFRTSSKASFDGILAMKGNTTNPNRVTECGDAHQRMMVDEATCNFTSGTCTGTKCVTVTGAASDVQAPSFDQESHGDLLGPLGGAYTNRSFKGSGAVDATGLNNCRPMVVPFAFFANTTVTKGGLTIENITTADARLIFSGQVYDWGDLSGYDAQPIQVCLRHAGSGTHATIDLAVMRPAALQTVQDTDGSYHFYFNDGSSDLMKCVNGSGSWTGHGAIGYADADQSLASYTNSTRLDYNGVEPIKADIINGSYDFWSIQNLYHSPSDPWIPTLCNFAKDPTKISNPYWAAECQLVYTKATDKSYLTYRGNVCP